MSTTVEGAIRSAAIPVALAAGASLSDPIDAGDLRAARVQIPSAWTTANLTFQTSIDGVTYADLYDGNATEYTIQAAASREILLPMVDFLGVRYLKIRSGTSGTPVAQAAARKLLLGLAA